MTPGVERAAAEAVARVAERVAERVRGVPALSVSVDEGAVTVRGRALRRRLVEEPALGRWGGVR